MGQTSHLKPDEIVVITALCHAEKSNKYISDYTGIHIRSVQRWAPRSRESSLNCKENRQANLGN